MLENPSNILANFFEGDIGSIANVAGLFALVITGILSVVLLEKNRHLTALKKSLKKVKHSLEELDEQAKLIVKTDLTLNKTQEELDRRLNSLNALHRTSALISTTLDANEIFRRLGKSLVVELGFKKSMILAFDENKALRCHTELGFGKETAERICSRFPQERGLDGVLKEGHRFSSLNGAKGQREKINQLFNVEHFILSPILTQDGTVGVLFVGNSSSEEAITQGDEELVSILTNQVGQSLENAQLFEEVFRSRQELELKIQERTRELTRALEGLQEISKAKSEFVSAVSHELRTPLTSIKGYASLLMTGKIGEIPPAVKERLEKINKHSDSLVKFINDLLDIARIESGRAVMNLEPHALIKITDNVRDLLAPQLREKNIRFTADIDSTLPLVLIDAGQIERAFINLVTNSIKFTPQDGQITVKASLQNEKILCEISDTGIGIPKEDLPKLFDAFYRVENTINQNVKGTGLGLTLVKNIIEAHHGKIWVTSQPNQGAQVYFTLPLSQKKQHP